MDDENRPKDTFLNRRDWGSYVAALQSAATYPHVLEVMKTGHAWFSEGAAQASTWLVGAKILREKFSTG